MPRPRRLGLLPAWSSRNFDLILMARIVMSVGRALAGVATPVYLALEGFSAFELAEYILVVALASALFSSLIGLWSDRVGRRPFLVALPILTAVAGVAFAVTGNHLVLFVMGAAGSFGRGAGAGGGTVGPYQPAESALVTDDLPSTRRNAAFGRLAFGSSAGATVGGLLALTVSAGHVHGAAATALFRPAFIAIAVASALAGLLALGLTEPGQRTTPGSPSGSPSPDPTELAQLDAGDEESAAAPGSPPTRTFRLPTRSRWLLYRLWATNTFNGLAVGMFGPFVTYWFFRRFDASASEIGVLFAVINVITMFSSLSAAALARRWGLVRTVTVVRTAQALLLVPMVLAPTFVLAGATYLVRMMIQRIAMPLRQSYAVGLADPAERGSVAALANLPSQLAMSGSPLVTGYLFDEVSLSLPFEIAAGLQLVNAGTFWAFFRHHPPEEERAPLEPAARPGWRAADEAAVPVEVPGESRRSNG